MFYHIQYKYLRLTLKKEFYKKIQVDKNWHNFGIVLCWVPLLKPFKKTTSMILRRHLTTQCDMRLDKEKDGQRSVKEMKYVTFNGSDITKGYKINDLGFFC